MPTPSGDTQYVAVLSIMQSFDCLSFETETNEIVLCTNPVILGIDRRD